MSEAAEFYTEEMTLNMGPQHPSTHGVLRFVLKTDGEVLREVKPVVGYLHRGLEKIAEMVTYPQFMPYTDRVDYLAAMFCNEGYARVVEKLADIEVPPRAQYLRGHRRRAQPHHQPPGGGGLRGPGPGGHHPLRARPARARMVSTTA